MAVKMWGVRAVSMALAMTVITIASPSMTLTRAEVAVMSMAQSSLDPIRECEEQCYAEYRYGEAQCQRVADNYGGYSSWAYESCRWTLDYAYYNCLDQCFPA